MSRFKTRPGVVLTEICGEHVLVTARSVMRECPFVTNVNEESAFLWRKLKYGADEEELMRAVEEEYEVEDPAELREGIRAFIERMLEFKLITEEQNETGDVRER